MTAILGIFAFYHDSAAALVVDGQIVAAAAEERFTRRKYDARFPSQAIKYCLDEAGMSANRIEMESELRFPHSLGLIYSTITSLRFSLPLFLAPGTFSETRFMLLCRVGATHAI